MLSVICATESEYINIKRYAMIKKELINKDHKLSICHTSEQEEYIIMCSKPGFNNVKASTEYLLYNYNIKCILSVGMAGGLDERFKVGDVIISDSVYLIDKEIKCFLIDKIFSNKLYEIFKEHANNQKIRGLFPHVYMGSIISINEVISNNRKAEYLQTHYRGSCVEMESGIVANACNCSNITFAAIKIISDFANEFSFVDMGKYHLKVTCILGSLLHKILPPLIKNFKAKQSI